MRSSSSLFVGNAPSTAAKSDFTADSLHSVVLVAMPGLLVDVFMQVPSLDDGRVLWLADHHGRAYQRLGR
jgi:hypothetical protein